MENSDRRSAALRFSSTFKTMSTLATPAPKAWKLATTAPFARTTISVPLAFSAKAIPTGWTNWASIWVEMHPPLPQTRMATPTDSLRFSGASTAWCTLVSVEMPIADRRLVIR